MTTRNKFINNKASPFLNNAHAETTVPTGRMIMASSSDRQAPTTISGKRGGAQLPSAVTNVSPLSGIYDFPFKQQQQTMPPLSNVTVHQRQRRRGEVSKSITEVATRRHHPQPVSTPVEYPASVIEQQGGNQELDDRRDQFMGENAVIANSVQARHQKEPLLDAEPELGRKIGGVIGSSSPPPPTLAGKHAAVAPVLPSGSEYDRSLVHSNGGAPSMPISRGHESFESRQIAKRPVIRKRNNTLHAANVSANSVDVHGAMPFGMYAAKNTTSLRRRAAPGQPDGFAVVSAPAGEIAGSQGNVVNDGMASRLPPSTWFKNSAGLSQMTRNSRQVQPHSMGRDAHSSIENYVAGGGATSYMMSGDVVSGVSGAEPLNRTTNLTQATNTNMKRRQFNVIRSQKYRDRKAIIIEAGKSSGRRAYPEAPPATVISTTNEEIIEQPLPQQRSTLRQIRPQRLEQLRRQVRTTNLTNAEQKVAGSSPVQAVLRQENKTEGNEIDQRASVGKRGASKFSAGATDKYTRTNEIVNIKTRTGRDEEQAAIVESFGIIGKVNKKSVHFQNGLYSDRHNKFRASPYSKRLAPAYNVAAALAPKAQRNTEPGSGNNVEVGMAGENQVGGERVDKGVVANIKKQVQPSGHVQFPPARKQLAQRTLRDALTVNGVSPGPNRGERDRSEPLGSAFHNNYRPSQLPGLSGFNSTTNNNQQNMTFCPKQQINQVRRVYENAFLPSQGREPTEQERQKQRQLAALKGYKPKRKTGREKKSATAVRPVKQQEEPPIALQETHKNIVAAVIDKIHLKIDDLRDNLVNYEQKIDLTLKEIPPYPAGDIRSLNNSNFNISSSRYNEIEHYSQGGLGFGAAEPPRISQIQQSQRLDQGLINVDSPIHVEATDLLGEQLDFDQLQKSGKVNMTQVGGNIFNDNLSERTLKTILNLQSERAQTQQQKRGGVPPIGSHNHESTKNYFAANGHNFRRLFQGGDSHLSYQSNVHSGLSHVDASNTNGEVDDIFVNVGNDLSAYQRLVTSRQSKTRGAQRTHLAQKTMMLVHQGVPHDSDHL